MRGKIDLGQHKLANVFRAPAAGSRWRRTKLQKCPDATYQQLWRLTDGAVRDAFANHPEYLTDKGRHSATQSVVKRVVGTIHGYATQVARGRSGGEADVLVLTAADEIASSSSKGRDPTTCALVSAMSRMRATVTRILGGGRLGAPPEIHGGER
jgi:hypothetical protein